MPAPFWEAWAAWWIMGLGNAVPLTLLPPAALKFMVDRGINEESASVASATLTIGWTALGLLIGPGGAAPLADTIGVPWTNTVLGTFIGVPSFLSIAYMKAVEKSSAAPLL